MIYTLKKHSLASALLHYVQATPPAVDDWYCSSVPTLWEALVLRSLGNHRLYFPKPVPVWCPGRRRFTPSMYLYVYVCVLLRVGKKAKRSLGIFLVIWTLTHTKKKKVQEKKESTSKSLCPKNSPLFPRAFLFLKSEIKNVSLRTTNTLGPFLTVKVGCQHSINQKKQEYLNGKILPSQYFSP